MRWASLDSADPLLAYLTATRRSRPVGARVRAAVPAFVPAAVCLGLAYTALLVAFSRGKVTVVAPLNATQSLWASSSPPPSSAARRRSERASSWQPSSSSSAVC